MVMARLGLAHKEYAGQNHMPWMQNDSRIKTLSSTLARLR